MFGAGSSQSRAQGSWWARSGRGRCAQLFPLATCSYVDAPHRQRVRLTVLRRASSRSAWLPSSAARVGVARLAMFQPGTSLVTNPGATMDEMQAARRWRRAGHSSPGRRSRPTRAPPPRPSHSTRADPAGISRERLVDLRHDPPRGGPGSACASTSPCRGGAPLWAQDAGPIPAEARTPRLRVEPSSHRVRGFRSRRRDALLGPLCAAGSDDAAAAGRPLGASGTSRTSVRTLIRRPPPALPWRRAAGALSRARRRGLERSAGSSGHGHDQILIGALAARGTSRAAAREAPRGPPGHFGMTKPLRFVRALYCVDSRTGL